jgi:hypothetical protein
VGGGGTVARAIALPHPLEGLVHDQLGLTVVGVDEHDDGDALSRAEPHVRTIATQRSAVAHERALPHAIHVEAEPPAGLPFRLEPMHPLHLAQRAAAEDPIAGRWTVLKLQHREARQIGHARRQRGRCRDAAQIVRTDRAALAARQAPRVTAREPRMREPRIFDQ